MCGAIPVVAVVMLLFLLVLLDIAGMVYAVMLYPDAFIPVVVVGVAVYAVLVIIFVLCLVKLTDQYRRVEGEVNG